MTLKIRDIIKEFDLKAEELKDKEIQKFLLQVLYRKQTNEWIQYHNGNAFIEINKKNGTSIRTILTDEEYKPLFPENIDMTISEHCINGCKFCYANCTPQGKEADITKYLDDKTSFLYSLHPGTELALNGNEPLHPDLKLLLEFCKERDVLANLTVNENTLLLHKDELDNYLSQGLIHGIGISPTKYSKDLIDFCKEHPTAVIHTIAGITTQSQFNKLKNNNLKILILGYKNFSRRIDYENIVGEKIHKNIQKLGQELKDNNFFSSFQVVSFDNLGVEQLNIKTILNKEEWGTFYRGDDGKHTLYIDLVNETFAKNSIQPKENHLPIKKTAEEMLKIVREQ